MTTYDHHSERRRRGRRAGPARTSLGGHNDDAWRTAPSPG